MTHTIYSVLLTIKPKDEARNIFSFSFFFIICFSSSRIGTLPFSKQNATYPKAPAIGGRAFLLVRKMGLWCGVFYLAVGVAQMRSKGLTNCERLKED
jgi:hypothetical protein